MSKTYNLTGPNDYYAQQLLVAIHAHNNKGVKPVDIKLVQKAIDYLEIYYSTLQEEANLQVYAKPTKLALMLSSYYLTNESLVATLLYDMAKEQRIEQAQVEKTFGKRIADKLSNLLTLQITTSTIAGLQHIDQVIAQGDRDILVIRLLDHLCTVEGVGLQSKYEQLEVALQSIQTFVPLAAYMCLHVVETQLMDRCKLIITPELLKDSSIAANPVIEIAGFKFQL